MVFSLGENENFLGVENNIVLYELFKQSVLSKFR